MILRDLGDGLVLRGATRADTEALVAFNARIHAAPDAAEPDPFTAAWTRDLLERPHPTFKPADFTIVEDTRTGRIVSSLNLISQTWSYGGIPFGVGRIELVGTEPDYRRRGLVRAQFDVVHDWSRQRGELAQGITGIPWYYRQFGYEYALTLDGGKMARRAALPDPAGGRDDPYGVRPATAADVPFIAAVDAQARGRYLVSAMRDAALWRHELDGRSSGSSERFGLGVIESAAGEPVGFVVHAERIIGTGLVVRACELAPGVSWLAARDGLLRYLRARCAEYERQPGAKSCENVTFLLEHDHPLYNAMPRRLPETVDSYAWYVRVPDPPALVRRIAPVLESQLEASVACGYTGTLLLNFYRSGLQITFTNGCLDAAEPWPAANRTDAHASFPDLTFLQILFGYRSLAEIESFFPDCLAEKEPGRVLLDALFPKQSSFVWGVV